ncbi:MAG: molybdopterin-binding protein [Methanocellales archaeon]
MNAEIITIGNEILAGDIVNTNATWLAKKLNLMGVRVEKITAIGDDAEKIAKTIKSSEADWVLVTGGLGPTHDDVTREGIARALGKKLVRSEQAARMIQQKDANPLQLVMADLPEGAIPIENPAGMAPGFIIENIIALPGVPRELEAMFPLIAFKFTACQIFVEWIQTTKREIELVEVLNEAVKQFPEVKIGSYPAGEVVRIKLTSVSAKAVELAKLWLKENFNKK